LTSPVEAPPPPAGQNRIEFSIAMEIPYGDAIQEPGCV